MRDADRNSWPSYGIQPIRRKPVALIFAFCLLPFAFLLWPGAGGAHEPITTKIMFNKEVVRVLQRNCLACHHEGGIAPWSFVTYEEARPWAKAIKEELLEKRMPPWQAVKGYGEFRNTPALTQREIDMIVNWVEGGAPPGKPENLPKEPLVSDDWPLGKPDMVLKPETEQEVASDADERRPIALAGSIKEDRWVTAVDLRPGNGSVVHCATIYVVEGGSGIEQVKEVKGNSSRIRSLSSVLGTWMPGQNTVALPEGTAQLVRAGSSIVLEIHYRGAGEAVKDSSEVGLYFATSPPRKQAREVAITSPDAMIPAGVQSHRVVATFTLNEDAEAVAIRPCVNPLVVSLQATARRPEGSQEILVWARGYRFDWQPTYIYKRPVALPKGTQIEVIAYFDNSENNRRNPSSPPKAVRWSEVSKDPLCALLIANAANEKGSTGQR
ncbi:MAG: cytochrome c [Blastocatellia bacterium]|nr:cytochrome c [Blastocatellia bacterium]